MWRYYYRYVPQYHIQKEGFQMTRAEIVEKAAEEAGISKVAAGKVFQAVISCINGALTNGEKVCFVGFGTFSVVDRAARKGRNPRTGKEIKIAARKVPKFTAGSKLKTAVNEKAAAKKTTAKKAAAKAKKK